jgi:hypothetical protein
MGVSTRPDNPYRSCNGDPECSPASRLCVARNYTPGTEAYRRCIVSIENDRRNAIR